MEAALGWRDNDAMGLSTMASLADGGSGDGDGRRQLCSSNWCCRHQPFIGVSFGRGASKSTTQGGIFNLKLYITFDCANSMAF